MKIDYDYQSLESFFSKLLLLTIVDNILTKRYLENYD